MKKNIIIVEDEVIIAQDVKLELERYNYNVVDIVVNAESLFNVLDNREDVELVLMDIMINGEMDGIETAKIVSNRYQLPVVFLTAYSDEITLQRAKEAKPFGYLIKPFETRELYTVLEMAIFRHKMEQEYLCYKNILDSVVNSINEGVIVVNSKKQIMFMNDFASKLFNLKNYKRIYIDDVYIRKRIRTEDVIGFDEIESDKVNYISININGENKVFEESITYLNSNELKESFVIIFKIIS